MANNGLNQALCPDTPLQLRERAAGEDAFHRRLRMTSPNCLTRPDNPSPAVQSIIAIDLQRNATVTSSTTPVNIRTHNVTSGADVSHSTIADILIMAPSSSESSALLSHHLVFSSAPNPDPLNISASSFQSWPTHHGSPIPCILRRLCGRPNRNSIRQSCPPLALLARLERPEHPMKAAHSSEKNLSSRAISSARCTSWIDRIKYVVIDLFSLLFYSCPK